MNNRPTSIPTEPTKIQKVAAAAHELFLNHDEAGYSREEIAAGVARALQHECRFDHYAMSHAEMAADKLESLVR